MRVLLLSAYAAQSHVYWQDSLQAMLADFQWQVLSLPPRHFNWRVRGNPLYWSQAERDVLEQDYDLLLATSMVDLATLRGLVPALAALPTVLYFHENQFEYPAGQQRHGLLEAQMVSLYSALAADRVLFNSAYNLESFLSGLETLLDKLPDRVPVGVVHSLREKSIVLPVPIDTTALCQDEGNWPGSAGALNQRPLRLLWAGRFEYDKGGERLQLLLRQLEARGLDYELAVVGQQFRSSPAVFGDIEREFQHRLVQFGYLQEKRDYLALLRGADLVLSTALHEFQGVAVLEAVASGCVPVLPERLCYPELYGEKYCYSSCLEDPEREAVAAAELVIECAGKLAQGTAKAPDVSGFGRGPLAATYRALFTGLGDAWDSQ